MEKVPPKSQKLISEIEEKWNQAISAKDSSAIAVSFQEDV
jgi:ketosteroid isomerase-like protein